MEIIKITYRTGPTNRSYHADYSISKEPSLWDLRITLLEEAIWATKANNFVTSALHNSDSLTIEWLTSLAKETFGSEPVVERISKTIRRMGVPCLTLELKD